MTIDERVARLERENRGLRLATLGLGTSLLVILLGSCGRGTVVPAAATANATAKEKAGADDPPALESATSEVHDVMRAHRFELLDSNRKLLAVLGMDNKSGKPGLVLLNENGKTRAALGVFDDGKPGLVLMDENGRQRATLGVPKAGPILELWDKNDRARAKLMLNDDGEAGLLGLFDEDGNMRAMLAVDKKGPLLSLLGENGKGRTTLSMGKDGPLVYLLDENGHVLGRLP
jgi:hypothetical protein